MQHRGHPLLHHVVMAKIRLSSPPLWAIHEAIPIPFARGGEEGRQDRHARG